MVDLNGHEAGNGGYSQRKPTAHRVSSTRSVRVPSSGMRQNEFCRSRGLSLSTRARHLKKRRWKRKRKNSRAEYKLLGVELAAEKSAEERKIDYRVGLGVVRRVQDRGAARC